MRLPSLDETEGAGPGPLLSPLERRTSRQQSVLMGVPSRKRAGGAPDDPVAPINTPPRTMGRQSVALDGNPMNLPMIGRKMGQKRESRAFSIMDSDGPMAAQV